MMPSWPQYFSPCLQTKNKQTKQNHSPRKIRYTFIVEPRLHFPMRMRDRGVDTIQVRYSFQADFIISTKYSSLSIEALTPL